MTRIKNGEKHGERAKMRAPVWLRTRKRKRRLKNILGEKNMREERKLRSMSLGTY